MIRDSSGIVIVENIEPTWEPNEGWKLSSEPLLTIGVLDGPEEYMLFRAGDALRFDDGRILVMNSGSHELRFYDAQGVFLHSAGREGDGPGEFRNLSYCWRTSLDSLVVYDWRLRRFSVLDSSGGFVRAFSIGPGEGVFAYPDGVFGDGTILASVDEQDQGNYSELGIVRGRSRYGSYDAEGEHLRTLASLPGAELYKGTHPDGSGFTTSASHAVRPFAAAGTSSWFYGSADAFQFQEWSQEGELLKIIRVGRMRRSMPGEVHRAREERLRERRETGGTSLWDQIPLPDSLPTHEELIPDREGNLWIQGYVVLEEEPIWSVIDTAGRWLGDLPTPEELRITEIGGSYLMGIWSDTLGVQQVRVYGLEKDGSL